MILLALLMMLILKETETKLLGNVSFENWTTCEQFLEGTTFDRYSVLAIDWRIFYFYNFEHEGSYHIRFNLAPKGIVDRFKAGLSKVLDPPVNWTDAEYFMETSIDFSALFIKTNVSGLYRIIPSYAFQNDKTSLFHLALKTVESGYLGMVNCKFRLCYVLAPSDRMPYDDELEEAAQTVGFKAESHYSYREPSPRPPPTTHDNGDDMPEEEDMEIDDDPSRSTFVQ